MLPQDVLCTVHAVQQQRQVQRKEAEEEKEVQVPEDLVVVVVVVVVVGAGGSATTVSACDGGMVCFFLLNDVHYNFNHRQALIVKGKGNELQVPEDMMGVVVMVENAVNNTVAVVVVVGWGGGVCRV